MYYICNIYEVYMTYANKKATQTTHILHRTRSNIFVHAHFLVRQQLRHRGGAGELCLAKPLAFRDVADAQVARGPRRWPGDDQHRGSENLGLGWRNGGRNGCEMEEEVDIWSGYMKWYEYDDSMTEGERLSPFLHVPPKVIAACAAAARWRNSLAFASHGCDVPVDIVGLTAALSACGGAPMILHVILWSFLQLMISRVRMPEKRIEKQICIFSIFIFDLVRQFFGIYKLHFCRWSVGPCASNAIFNAWKASADEHYNCQCSYQCQDLDSLWWFRTLQIWIWFNFWWPKVLWKFWWKIKISCVRYSRPVEIDGNWRSCYLRGCNH